MRSVRSVGENKFLCERKISVGYTWGLVFHGFHGLTRICCGIAATEGLYALLGKRLFNYPITKRMMAYSSAAARYTATIMEQRLNPHAKDSPHDLTLRKRFVVIP